MVSSGGYLRNAFCCNDLCYIKKMKKKRIKVKSTLEKDGIYKTRCCRVYAYQSSLHTRAKCSRCNKNI